MLSTTRKLTLYRSLLLVCTALISNVLAKAQTSEQPNNAQIVTTLLKRLADDEARIAAGEARIHELERKLGTQDQVVSSSAQPAPDTAAAEVPVAITQSPAPAEAVSDPHDHMEMGGPALKLRGFMDLNAGVGRSASPLAYPLNAPDHATFQLGQFDLFFSSKLSQKLSFMSEVAIGSSVSNAWDLDIERVQLSYHVNDYLDISGGRYHTSIGYYNTAFHHGSWFQTATGRPFMYFFEDDGGLLPVHSVGLSMSGLVPGTEKLGLHWIAETTNGRASDRNKEPVQNFLADKDGKGFNLAGYIAPVWAHGLQIGGSFYHDRQKPTGLGHVDQNIGSFYAVYATPTWELLNEAVLLSHKVENNNALTRTPMAYTQVSRRFGPYRPFFRYQYVDSPVNDPLNTFLGTLTGPSAGIRWDTSDYAAFKLQYNRFAQTGAAPSNGVDAQLAFTF